VPLESFREVCSLHCLRFRISFTRLSFSPVKVLVCACSVNRAGWPSLFSNLYATYTLLDFSPDSISSGSSELRGSGATQFAAAATSQNAAGHAGDLVIWRRCRVFAMSQRSSLDSSSTSTRAARHSAFWLVAATANWVASRPFSPDESRSVDMISDEVRGLRWREWLNSF